MTSKTSVHLTGYWEGYVEDSQDPFPLNKVSKKVNYIPIAFIMPVKEHADDELATQWAFDTQIIYTKEQIKAWVREINDRGLGQKVLLSILDTPQTHWYPHVDIDKFAFNIAQSVDEWGLGGIDVDAESGMSDPDAHYVQTFVLLIKSLRKYLSADKLISYTAYTASQWDSEIIGQCKEDIDFVNTMAYWNGTQAQIDLYKHYANDIGDVNKVGVGVKAGETQMDTVSGVANWYRDNSDIQHKRMMLWSCTRDVEAITQQTDEMYLDTLYRNIIANENGAVPVHTYKDICAQCPVMVQKEPRQIRAVDKYNANKMTMHLHSCASDRKSSNAKRIKLKKHSRRKKLRGNEWVIVDEEAVVAQTADQSAQSSILLWMKRTFAMASFL